jgi:hypothetical protein
MGFNGVLAICLKGVQTLVHPTWVLVVSFLRDQAAMQLSIKNRLTPTVFTI